MVQELTEKIASKKDVLTPMIRDLRTLQTQARAIEVRWDGSVDRVEANSLF